MDQRRLFDAARVFKQAITGEPSDEWRPLMNRYIALLRKDPEVQKWLDEIIPKSFPVRAKTLIKMKLLPFICVTVQDRSISHAEWKRIWTVNTGKNWKSVSEFPDRILRLASDIERLNGSVFLGMAQNEGEIARLPGVLKEYASQLENQIKGIPDLTRKVIPSYRGYSPYLFELSHLVKAWTGKHFRDAEVANLLNAANRALRIKREDYDALDLAQARSRRNTTFHS